MTIISTLSRVPFVRFAMVGGCGYLIDVAILWIATHHLGLDPYSGRALSIFVSMFCTWLGNRYITFSGGAARNGARAVAKEYLKFVGANLVGALFNYGVYATLVASASPPFSDKFVAQACGTLVGMMFNFFLSKHFVFSAGKN